MPKQFHTGSILQIRATSVWQCMYICILQLTTEDACWETEHSIFLESGMRIVNQTSPPVIVAPLPHFLSSCCLSYIAKSTSHILTVTDIPLPRLTVAPDQKPAFSGGFHLFLLFPLLGLFARIQHMPCPALLWSSSTHSGNSLFSSNVLVNHILYNYTYSISPLPCFHHHWTPPHVSHLLSSRHPPKSMQHQVCITTTLKSIVHLVASCCIFIPTLIMGVMYFLLLSLFGGGGRSKSDELESSSTFQNTA